MSWIFWVLCLALGIALGLGLRRMSWWSALRPGARYLQPYYPPEDARRQEP